ncbi:MAG: hypothetical protein K8T10_05490 [Candidatus Eremiobacteraeota bacterium]|nr:hypothetical protein [Candidatus Eremiobacteraeota bacterium]
MKERKLIYTPRQITKPRKKEDKYKQLPEEVAIYKKRYAKKFSRLLLVIVLVILLVALYFLMKAFFTPQPKIYLKLYEPESYGFKHTTIKEINERLQKDGSVMLQVKAIAKQDSYPSASTGQKVNRDYVQVKFVNLDNNEIGKSFFELKPTEAKKMEGMGEVIIKYDRFRNNIIQENVIVTLTNRTRTADKLPVRASIMEQQ